MINTSTEYKKAIQKDREFRIQDTITFKDGTKQGKTITLSTGDFMSYSINGATSSSGKFDIGAAVIKKYTAVLNNMNDKFSEYDFEGADIRSYIGLKLEDGSWEVLSKGTYRVCKARSKDLTISIEAYDYMLFFDQPYSKSKLSYPATINEIIADACLNCQMTYNAQTIQNGRFTVEKRPEDEALTFRDILSYCAQIMCCYARISNTNALEFGWYDFSIFDRNDNVLDGGNLYDYTGSNADGGNFKDYIGDINDGGSFADQRDFHHLYLLGSQDIDVADIVITGVKATADNSSDENKTESFLYGTEDYALSLEGNPLIQGGRVEEVARYVGPRIVGRRFRPLSITCLSDPSIEEGDVAYVTDRKNNTYKTVITNTTFSMGGYQSVVCDAETKTENNYTRYGAETKLLAQAHKDMQNEISQYDIAVQQLNSLALNSLGYYETITREEDGSMIKYMHDKPNMKDSKVVYKRSIDGFFISLDGGDNFKSGFDKYGNAVLNVIQAIGINFDWASGGTLTLGGKDHENGVLKLLDKNDKLIMTLTEDGIDVLKGNISGSTINNGNGTFTVDEIGNTVANSFKSKSAEITGGIFKIDLAGNRYDIIKLKNMDTSLNIDVGRILMTDVVTSENDINTAYYGASGVSCYSEPSGSKSYLSNSDLTFKDGEDQKTRVGYSGITMFGVSDIYGFGTDGILSCDSLFVRDGDKSKVVTTSNYGKRKLYCYEMPTPVFGDIGRAILDRTGTCYIYLEDVFAETVDTYCLYNVFLQKYGQGDLWVDDLQSHFFIVKGTVGLEFAWEIKLKQKGHESARLEVFKLKEKEESIDYISEAASYLNNYKKELLNYE